MLIWLLILMLQVIAAFCFCRLKTGYHYDEYYSYYSSNATVGIGPWDQAWKTGNEIWQEFAVLEGEQFQFSRVVEMQTYDVHPPVYYLILHTICSFVPGVFSKWTGLAVNLLFFVGSWLLLSWLAWHVGGRRKAVVYASCLLYGFNPAVFGGIMFVRMYTMLGFWVLLLTCLHVKALEERKRGWKFYLPLAAVVMAGFLTHYYFAVYLFFLAAAMEFYLLLEKDSGKDLAGRLGNCFVYGFVTVGAMLASVVLYPACAGHIFKGYRGTEAMGAFFDLSNTMGRVTFFTGLLNDYAFGSMLPLLILVLLLLTLTYGALLRVKKGTDSAMKISWRQLAGRQHIRLILGAASLGYFAVVTKTALLNAEEANRYQLPVYGLLLMLSMILFVLLAEKVCALMSGQAKNKICGVLTVTMILLLTAGQIAGLGSGKVLFLYQEDQAAIETAKENHDTVVVYFFGNEQKWMTWDDSLELMQYDNLYFVSLSDEEALKTVDFSDARIADADRLLVYCMRHDNSQTALEVLLDHCTKLEQYELTRELLYCDLYELKP